MKNIHTFSLVITPTITPPDTKTVITIRKADGSLVVYGFEGFLLLSHTGTEADLLPHTFNRGGIEYTVKLVPQKVPENFSWDYAAIEWFHEYLFGSILRVNNWLLPTQSHYNIAHISGCRR